MEKSVPVSEFAQRSDLDEDVASAIEVLSLEEESLRADPSLRSG
jgi:hypothetical protein